MLSMGSRFVLINSVLSSLPMYVMSFLAIPKEFFYEIDADAHNFYISIFFF